MTWGMKFSETGTPVSDESNLIYTTDRNQLKVDVTADPPHLGFLNPITGFTNLTTTSSSPLASEVLFQVEHRMPFRPSVSLYMNIVDTPVNYAYYIGSYTVDFLRLGGTLVYADVDDKYFYIRHDMYYNFNMGAPATQTETEMNLLKIRAKYLISNARYVGQTTQSA